MSAKFTNMNRIETINAAAMELTFLQDNTRERAEVLSNKPGYLTPAELAKLKALDEEDRLLGVALHALKSVLARLPLTEVKE